MYGLKDESKIVSRRNSGFCDFKLCNKTEKFI